MAAPILLYITKVGHWRKDVLELQGHAPFCFHFFYKRCLQINWTVSFYLYFCIWNRVRSVSFSDGGIHDSDIIFRDDTDLVFCFLGCVDTLLHAKLTAGGEGQLSVCLFVFFFPFLPFWLFFTIKLYTNINKEGAKTCGKAERRQRAVSSLHPISGWQINVWLAAFI